MLFYEKIDFLCEVKDVNRKKMCTDIGLSYNSYNSMLRRKSSSITLDNIKSIADYFEVCADYLVREDIAISDYVRETQFCDSGNNSIPSAPPAHRIARAYDRADDHTQRVVEVTLSPYMEEDSIAYERFRISEQSAAAGSGVYLGPEEFTEYDVDSSKLPRGAFFGVPIRGDSMEPQFHDGDIAIVSKDEPGEGDAGVFIMGGDGYIKKRGKNMLISLNKEYKDIRITDEVRTCGKVIGTITWGDVRK